MLLFKKTRIQKKSESEDSLFFAKTYRIADTSLSNFVQIVQIKNQHIATILQSHTLRCISQIISTVATKMTVKKRCLKSKSFHIANGRCCCNRKQEVSDAYLKEFQYHKRLVLLPDHLYFTFDLLRYLRCEGLIVALALCCLAPFGVYRKQ